MWSEQQGKTRTRWMPNHAPFVIWMTSHKESHHRSKRGPYVKRVYELYITGSHSLKEIAEILYTEGLRTASVTKFFKIRFTEFLTANLPRLMERDGKVYEGKHPALISRDVFDMHKTFFMVAYITQANSFLFSSRFSFVAHAMYYHCRKHKKLFLLSLHYVKHLWPEKNFMRSEFIDNLLSNIFQELKIEPELIELSFEAYKAQNQSKLAYTLLQQLTWRMNYPDCQQKNLCLQTAILLNPP